MSRRAVFVLLLILVALAAACSPTPAPTATPVPPTEAPTLEPTAEATTAAEAVQEVATEVVEAVEGAATEVVAAVEATTAPVATNVAEAEATVEAVATALPTEVAEVATEVAAEATEVSTEGALVVAPGDPIVLGSASGLSGDGIAPLGVDIRRGIELALADRPTVTVGGQEFSVVLDAQDDLCSAEGGQAVANRFAADGSVVAVVGPMCSSACLAAAPIFDAAGYTTISPSCTNPRLTTSGYTSFNRAVASDAAQGVVAAYYIFNDLGITKIATIHDGSAYGEGLVSVVTDTFQSLGGEVVASDAISVGDTDFRGLLEDVSQEEPQLIYFGGFPAEAARLASQRGDAGLDDVLFFGADGILGTEFVELAGAASDGAYATSSVPNDSPALDAFLAKYVETYGEEPPAPYHANAYDAANIFLDAVEAVGQIDADGNLVVSRAALSEYVRSLKDFDGLVGLLANDGNGELVTSGAFTVSKVESGAFAGVASGSVADGVVTISPVEAAAEATVEPTEEATAEPTAVPPTEEPTVAPTAEPTLEPTALPTEAAAAPVSTEGALVVAPGDAVVLGSASGLSGDGIAPLGEDIRRGVELALAERPTVTVNGTEFQVVLDAQDDLCSAEGGQAVANRFAADGSVVGVVGPMCSSACLAAAPIFDAAGYTTISPSCTNPRLTTSGYTSFNRAVASDAAQGVVAAYYLYNDLGVRKIATIHDGSAYGEGLVSVVTDTFQSLGGEVVASDAISVGDTDFRGLLEDIAQEDPELIYFGGFPAEAARIAIQRADAGLDQVPLFGADGILGTEFVELAGSGAAGTYATSSVPNDSPALDAFLAKYVETFGEEPPAPYHANGYDAANIFLDAIEAVGQVDADGNLVVSRAALSEYVRTLSAFDGLVGLLANDGNGELVTSGVFTISRVGDSGFSAIATGSVFGGEVTIIPVEAAEATPEATPAS
ncbi:MAG: ABC transporter substrate-binding protein [Anaerolineae bacterium]